MTACIGWNNLALSATITAGSAALPAQNVRGPHGSPSTAWQTAAGVVTSGAGATLTVTPTTGAQIWRVMGVFGSNLTASATVTFELWNTTGPTLVWSSALGGPVSGYRQVVAIPSADKVADYLKISIDDASNTDGFINIPLVFCGPSWSPQRNISYSSAPGREEQTLETISRGGQEYPVPLWQRRRWSVEFDSLANSEVWTTLDPLLMTSRSGINVFFCPDSASSYLQQEAVFGRLKTFSDITYPYQAADRRRCQVQITERL
jgi:hypothetical protein